MPVNACNSPAANPSAAQVRTTGCTYGRFPRLDDGTWDEFAKFWEDLPIDGYVTSEHRTRRYRRLGRVLARAAAGDDTVAVVPDASFFQSKQINSVYGGQRRTFAPVPGAFFRSPQTRDIIRRDLRIVRDIAGGDADYLITFHLIRIVATGDASSAPAPEGRHQDGHEYVAMHLINRQHCEGGVSRVYECGATRPVLAHTLTEAMETLVIDDRTMQHEVSPIVSDGADSAVRDMLIIDFDRVTDVERIATGDRIDLTEQL